MPVSRKKDSKYYWYDFRLNGSRYRGSTKETSLQKARNIEAAIMQEVAENGTPAKKKAMRLAEFAPDFLKFVEDGRLDADTKKYYRNGWRMLKAQPIAGIKIDEITSNHAATVKVKGSASTVNCALRTLRRMLSVAMDNGILRTAPKVHLAKENHRERLITVEEEDFILTHATPTLRDAFLLVFDTGMRPSEAAALRWDNVDFMRGVILIAEGKTPAARRHVGMTTRVLEMMKGRARSVRPDVEELAKERLLKSHAAVSAKAMQIHLDRARGAAIWVFPSPKYIGKHINGQSITAAFVKFKMLAGLPKNVVLYSARHTFGTDFMGQTGDLSKTKKQLGHGSISVTQRYLHPEIADSGKLMDDRNQNRHVSGHRPTVVQ